MRLRSVLVIIPAVMAGMGCSNESTLPQKDQAALKSNLNSPVDVEKVRAEYAKEHGPRTGAPTEGVD